MSIRSATFVKSVVGADSALEGDVPQIAFIGRSNVGKSTLINSLTRQKGLAKTSATPGHTKELNLFLINKSFHFIDLPGYGYAKSSREGQERLQGLIQWYLFDSDYEQKKVVLIIDANIGLTDNDMKMLYSLEEHKKDVVVVANKVDKIKKSEYTQRLQDIKDVVGNHAVIPYSSKTKIGGGQLLQEIFD